MQPVSSSYSCFYTAHARCHLAPSACTYSGFTFRSNIPYAVQRKLILCAYIHLYLKTRHKLPVYGIRNIRTERKSAVRTGMRSAAGLDSIIVQYVGQKFILPEVVSCYTVT